jgi:hypothetical protein
MQQDGMSVEQNRMPYDLRRDWNSLQVLGPHGREIVFEIEHDEVSDPLLFNEADDLGDGGIWAFARAVVFERVGDTRDFEHIAHETLRGLNFTARRNGDPFVAICLGLRLQDCVIEDGCGWTYRLQKLIELLR